MQKPAHEFNEEKEPENARHTHADAKRPVVILIDRLLREAL